MYFGGKDEYLRLNSWNAGQGMGMWGAKGMGKMTQMWIMGGGEHQLDYRGIGDGDDGSELMG